MTLDQLAGVYAEQGKYGEATILYRRVLAIYEKINPDENLDLADAAERFSALMEKMNRPVEAERWKSRAMTIRDNVGDKDRQGQSRRRRKKFQPFR